MQNPLVSAFFGLFLCLFSIQKADGQTEAEAARQLDSLEKSWLWQRGKIQFSDFGFSISAPDGLRFLGREQARFVLENLWGNAPDAMTLGLFFPENGSPLDSSIFAVELRFDEIGRVDPTDLKNFEPDFLLASLQKDQSALNSERKKMGQPSVEITGWALPPTLKKGENALFWAKKLRIEGDSGPERASSEARVLGKKGCAALNALGSMSDFRRIQKTVEELAAATVFEEKNDGSAAKKSAWSPAGLVAGRAFSETDFLSDFGKMALAALAFLGLFWFLKDRKKARLEK